MRNTLKYCLVVYVVIMSSMMGDGSLSFLNLHWTTETNPIASLHTSIRYLYNAGREGRQKGLAMALLYV